MLQFKRINVLVMSLIEDWLWYAINDFVIFRDLESKQ